MGHINRSNSLRICQWNAKSIMSKYNELTKHCEDFNIIMISETWLSPNKSFKVNGFDTVRKDRIGRTGGGVLIAVHNSIKYRRMQDIYDCDG